MSLLSPFSASAPLLPARCWGDGEVAQGQVERWRLGTPPEETVSCVGPPWGTGGLW